MDAMIKPLREDFVLMQPHILMGPRLALAVGNAFSKNPALEGRA